VLGECVFASLPDITSQFGYSTHDQNIQQIYALYRGPDSVVGIPTELRVGRSGDRIPVGGARFSAPIQTDPGVHPASCTMDTGSFPGGKERPGRDADPLHPSSAVGHEK
jgi:hypothetical protein